MQAYVKAKLKAKRKTGMAGSLTTPSPAHIPWPKGSRSTPVPLASDTGTLDMSGHSGRRREGNPSQHQWQAGPAHIEALAHEELHSSLIVL